MFKFRFSEACSRGDKNEAKRLYERNPAILNQQNSHGWTGLMCSLIGEHHTVSRWLLGRPGHDTGLTTISIAYTALHIACRYSAPLDIVVQLAELARRQGTLNRKDDSGRTGLDWAVKYGHTSIALHLAWLGAGCRVEYKLWPEGVTLQTWLDAGLAQDAQYWAIAANDVAALKTLRYKQDVTMDWPKQRELAKILNKWEAWSYLSSLRQLSWERLERTTPALATLPPVTLLQFGVPDHVVDIICDQRALTTVEALGLKASKLERAKQRLTAENQRLMAEIEELKGLLERTTSTMMTDQRFVDAEVEQSS